MSIRSEHVKIWRDRIKQRIIDAFNGKCGICGYNKCNAALELHHINPSEKDFSFGRIRANPKNWESLVRELRKCVLLCSNCHREIHNNVSELPKDIIRFDEDFADYKKIELSFKTETIINNCPICGKTKYVWNKTCSYNCANKLIGVYKWEEYNLEDLFLNKKYKIEDIADLIGCSNQAVIKQLIKQNLYKQKKKHLIKWPSKDILEKEVKEKSLKTICQEIGCSHTGLRRHLKTIDIKWYGPGFWQKKKFNKF